MHFGLSVVTFNGTPFIRRSIHSNASSVVITSIVHTSRTISSRENPRTPTNIHSVRFFPVPGSSTSRSFPQSNNRASPGLCTISGTTR